MAEDVARHLFRWLLVACITLLVAQVVSFLHPKFALAMEGTPRAMAFLCGLILFVSSIFMALFHSDRRLSFVGFVVSVLAMLVGSMPGFVRA